VIQIGDFLYATLIQETYAQILATLLDSKPEGGLIAEFGVYQGASINVIAKAHLNNVIHGFDSFEGLPDKWERGLDTYQPGHFGVGGKLPEVPANVRLHAGWFKDTIPPWLAANPGPVRFFNIDCDIYSSTKQILTLCNDRIIPGTGLYFDEICDWGGCGHRYPNWPEHEIKALREWCTEFNREVKPHSRNGSYGASVVVTK
jgi:hypothetical protein